jgi:hypothetical protein
MKALAKGFKDTLYRLRHPGKPVSEPDPAYGKPRRMTGLELTPEQRAKAAAYRGPINMGDAKLLKQ